MKTPGLLFNKRKRFAHICAISKMELDYKTNRSALSILEDIFVRREYSDYFPFHEDATIVDIGAHYGYFSIFASLNSGKQSKIYAVEPSKDNFIKLNRNIKSCNIHNIQTEQIAIIDVNGSSQLYGERSVNHSLLKEYALLGNNNFSQTVETYTLDHFLKERSIPYVDFLKLDCEGAEYPIIMNTPSEVFLKIKTISMEFHDLGAYNYKPQSLTTKLKKEGYEIVKYTFEKTNQNLNFGKIIGIKI